MIYYLEQSWEILRHKKMIDTIINFSCEFENKLQNELLNIETFNLDIIKQIDFVNEIYNSLSIEWYNIKLNDVKNINNWLWNQFDSNIEEYWIIKSYKRTLEMIINDYLWKNINFSKDDIVKINYYEFIEFFENRWEKLIDHNYRNHRVWMKWCDWFIPVDEIWKIDILVDYLFKEIQKIKNKLIQWIALHFLMIPIQPFWDWNWRLSRFLMNITFSNWWYQWCTIDQHNYRLLFLSSYNLINEEKYNELLEVYVNFMNFIFSYFNVDITK